MSLKELFAVSGFSVSYIYILRLRIINDVGFQNGYFCHSLLCILDRLRYNSAACLYVTKRLRILLSAKLYFFCSCISASPFCCHPLFAGFYHLLGVKKNIPTPLPPPDSPGDEKSSLYAANI